MLHLGSLSKVTPSNWLGLDWLTRGRQRLRLVESPHGYQPWEKYHVRIYGVLLKPTPTRT